jgi:hypothetical protein
MINSNDSNDQESQQSSENKDNVREIEISPEILREIQEAMKLTGDVQFSTAPDPNEQDQMKADVLISEVQSKPTRYAKESFCDSCCGTPHPAYNENFFIYQQDTPTSKYSVRILSIH